MSDAAIRTLMANLENLAASLNWLRRSFTSCDKIGIKTTYTEDEFDQFENLSSRYARTTDLLINKILRSIDAVELVDSGSVIDAANHAEKRGIIDSVSQLRELKDLRNEIAHEYETEDLSKLFALVLDATPRLFVLADRTVKYCGKYTG
ncbi:HepT-like ribonuclease domain-containing protein [Treponema primitia]|uniref:HepT-like ribonuclease domain-containing protein n=1 Tax=Treponema primitia TaxID=88058 RepID=UPI0002554C77|nr:HepT-like ribonuclease domain-containing protein [Treponema primitia]